MNEKMVAPRDLPASSMQTLFWRMQTADPYSKEYLVVKGFRIRGVLDAEVLRMSFESLVSAHPALRTVFIERGDELFQKVLPELPLSWEQVQVNTLEEYGGIEGMKKSFQDFLTQPFDLATGPLLRVRLLMCGIEDHLLQVAVHHIVSDRSSILLMLADLSTSYSSLLHGGVAGIEGDKTVIGDYALHERQWLKGAEGASGLLRRVRRLQKRGLHHPWPSWGGLPETSIHDTAAGGLFEHSFDSALSSGISDLSKKYGLSRFRVMLGAYFMTLQRMLPGRPVTAGVTMDMRRLLDDRQSMGCLINMLPVTLDGKSPSRIDDWLKNTSREVDESMGDARVPYPDILEAWTKGVGDLRSMRWRTLFNVKDSESARLVLEGCTCETLHEFLNEVLLDEGSSDLSITMTRIPGEKGARPIRMLLRYDEKVLARQQLEAIVESWESVLRQCIADPDAEVDSIQLPGVSGRYAKWQQELASPGTRGRLENYWKERLSALGEPVTLMPDLAKSNSGKVRIDTLSRELDTSIHALMDDLCRQERVSRFSVWVSIWQLLQSRIGSGEDVLLMVPVTEPGQAESMVVSGLYLNTLPIRTKVDGRSTFRTFSKNNHLSLAGDLAHGQLPYEDIVRLADGDLGTDGHGLPQVMFVWHGEYDWTEEEGAATSTSPKARNAKNPITVHFIDRGEVCRVRVEYDSDQFLEQTAQSILQRFETVARQVLANPDVQFQAIDILLPGERERLRDLSGRDNAVEYPATTLHGIFRQTAERYPDRPAVIDADGRETSYEDLQRQVLQVARFLRFKGIEKEAIVAVHLHRSPSLLATMLGVLEAGGAFFLMEPSLPMDRLRTMAEQARVVAVVTEDGMPIIPGFSDMTLLFDDILGSDTNEDVVKSIDASPDTLACVIFTSGSTGLPKGAMLEHVNLYNYLLFVRDSHALGEEVRSLQKTLLSFDVSLYELLLPMTAGGAVVMLPAGGEMDMQLVAEYVSRNHITCLYFAPAQLRLFLQVPDLEKVNRSLKLILSAGEELNGSLMEQCLSSLDARLFNAYGPAEAGAVTQWKCHRGHTYPKPSIGAPNCNVDIWIMDSMGRPVAPGMPGELWIGGTQTGRGYINNVEETRKRFVEDPIEPGSGRRHYRTGDLAQFLPDGNLLFHGRMDDQLKVRGVRVELGDVTAALMRCEGVREAVVLAESDGEGSNRLRAWVTLKNWTVANESSIRSSMADFLPSYMVPFRIHVIDSIPLTPHGKTDHRTLREIFGKEDTGAEGLPLLTSTEHRLAAIWSELLGVEVLHRDADFFRLGGHSLSAMRMAGMIHRDFKAFLPMTDFYDDGRLERIAAKIDRELGSEGATVDSRIDEYRTYMAWEGTGPGKVYSFFSGFVIIRRMADMSGWKWSVVNLTDPQVQRGETPDQPIEELAPVYADAILREHVGGPLVLMGNCISGIDTYATACLLQERTTDPIHVLLFDTRCTCSPDLPEPGLRSWSSPWKRLQRKSWEVGSDLFMRMADRGIRGFSSSGNALRLLCGEALRYRMFDHQWYLWQYPDVADAGVDPLYHYISRGWKELRDPSPIFNRSLYKSVCPTYDYSTQNPVLHYLLNGRLVHTVRTNVRALHTTQKEMEDIISAGWFDSDWYAMEFPSFNYRLCHPFYHYMAAGWKFGRKPYPDYDPELFCRRFQDFEPGKGNPLRHLLSKKTIPPRTGADGEPASGASVASGATQYKTGSVQFDLNRFGEWRKTANDADIITKRAVNRSVYRPGVFKGDLYVFANQYAHSQTPTHGWQNGPNGRVQSFRMNGDHESYLVDDLGSNVGKVDAIIRKILDQ